MTTTEEITKLAKEYAEDATKVMAGDPNLPASDLNGIKRDVAEYAEEVIRWLLRTHDIVKKSKMEEAEEVTIDGWVARDEDGKAYLHSIRPERGFDDDRNVGVWGNCVGYQMIALKRIFPDLTWESDPLEISITIKPKKKLSTG